MRDETRYLAIVHREESGEPGGKFYAPGAIQLLNVDKNRSLAGKKRRRARKSGELLPASHFETAWEEGAK